MLHSDQAKLPTTRCAAPRYQKERRIPLSSARKGRSIAVFASSVVRKSADRTDASHAPMDPDESKPSPHRPAGYLQEPKAVVLRDHSHIPQALGWRNIVPDSQPVNCGKAILPPHLQGTKTLYAKTQAAPCKALLLFSPSARN